MSDDPGSAAEPQMAPDRFHDLLERSLDRAEPAAPAAPPLEATLRAGRRRWRRRRAARGVAVVAAAAACVSVYVALGEHRAPSAPDPAGPSDRSVVSACLSARVIGSWHREGMSRAELARAMGDAVVMSRARTTYDVVATLRSADRRSWLACTLPQDARSRSHAGVQVFRTDVRLPRRVVDGRPAYARFAENDPRVAAPGDLGSPSWDVDCFPSGVTEDTAAFGRASARCPTFSVEYVDRVPTDVAQVRVHNPDGTVRWADVLDGYVSYGYSGRMTPAMRRDVRDHTASGPRYGLVTDLVYYDADGDVLARGRQALDRFPSLAYTLRRDLTR